MRCLCTGPQVSWGDLPGRTKWRRSDKLGRSRWSLCLTTPSCCLRRDTSRSGRDAACRWKSAGTLALCSLGTFWQRGLQSTEIPGEGAWRGLRGPQRTGYSRRWLRTQHREWGTVRRAWWESYTKSRDVSSTFILQGRKALVSNRQKGRIKHDPRHLRH